MWQFQVHIHVLIIDLLWEVTFYIPRLLTYIQYFLVKEGKQSKYTSINISMWEFPSLSSARKTYCLDPVIPLCPMVYLTEFSKKSSPPCSLYSFSLWTLGELSSVLPTILFLLKYLFLFQILILATFGGYIHDDRVSGLDWFAVLHRRGRG